MTTHLHGALGQRFRMSASQLVDFASEVLPAAPGRWWSFVQAWRSALFLVLPPSEQGAFIEGLRVPHQHIDSRLEMVRRDLLKGGLLTTSEPGGAIHFDAKTWEQSLWCDRSVYFDHRADSPDRLEHLRPFLRNATNVRLLDPYFAFNKHQKEGARKFLKMCASERVLRVEVWVAVCPPGGSGPRTPQSRIKRIETVKRKLQLDVAADWLKIRCFPKTPAFHDRVLQTGVSESLNNPEFGGPAFAMGRGVELFHKDMPSYLVHLTWRTAVQMFNALKGCEATTADWFEELPVRCGGSKKEES